MPRAKKEEGKEKQIEFLKLEGFEILKAREVEYKGKKNILADLKINGVTIYGCRPVTYTDKVTGEEKDFISWPERKGSDGKYYKVAYAPLNAEDQQSVCDAIYKKIDG